jgi:cell division protein FtsZ
MEFDLPKEQSSIIKVIGVGGGGCNAVNHMFQQGIKDVNFVICNTDAQALDTSPVPNKIQLGPGLTKGRGAGSHPSTGKDATMESLKEVKDLLEKNTEMVFVTAGMGGGTGTGGAPVIARTAREQGILTIGIITMPFGFEGKRRRQQAEQGLKEMRDNVDAILIISNDKLREIYGNLEFNAAFAKADDILATAAKGIAEIITVPGYVNVDFEDVKTVLRNSGLAIMGSARANGENRALEAVKNALASPLLNDSDISGATNILLNISSGAKPVLMDEISEITEFVQEAAGNDCDIIWGNCSDSALEDDILVTLIATGFETEKERKDRQSKEKVVRMILGSEEKAVMPEESAEDHFPTNQTTEAPFLKQEDDTPKNEDTTVKFELTSDNGKPRQFSFEFDGSMYEDEKEDDDAVGMNDETKAADDDMSFKVYMQKDIEEEHDEDNHMEAPIRRMEARPNLADNKDKLRRIHQQDDERIKRLKSLSLKLNNLDELEKTPAYMRRNIHLNDTPESSDDSFSKYSLTPGEDKDAGIKRNNSFLHDNVD